MPSACLLIIFSLQFFSYQLIAHAEEPPSEKGYKVYDKNGTLRAEKIMKDGAFIESKFYDENGNLSYEIKEGESVAQIMTKMKKYPIGVDTEEKKITGEDWIIMDPPAKSIYVFTAMEVLHSRYGVRLSKSPEEYTELIDSRLLEDSMIKTEDVTNILASVAYEHEPSIRAAIEKI